MNLINSISSPYFLCYSTVAQANATGDGTIATGLFNPVVQGGNFNIATGIFTATIAGMFFFMVKPDISNLGATANLAVYSLVTTAKTYQLTSYSAGGWRNTGSQGRFPAYVFAPMALNDTAKVTVQIFNTSKTLGIATNSLFSAIRLY